MSKLKEVEKQLNISEEDEIQIAFEIDLINRIISLREKKGLSQAELAEMAKIKQSQLARFEKATHSPQLNSVLKILYPLGYTLKLEKIESYLKSYE